MLYSTPYSQKSLVHSAICVLREVSVGGSRQIGPRQIGPRAMFCGKLGPGKLGPGRSGTGGLRVANWAPENLMVANWAPANWAPADRAPWRQIGPLENWDPEVTNTVLQNKLTQIYALGEYVEVEYIYILLLYLFCQQLGNIY